MLGISFYPNKESVESIKKYIDMASSLGFKRCFTSLLTVGEDVSQTINTFKQSIQHARLKNMEVIVDINPQLFSELNISYKDLNFFKNLGATGIRLDSNFDGLTESLISFDQSNIDIELNISNDTGNIRNIFSYEPNSKRLIGCHNFYPQPYTGLDLNYFLQCSKKYKALGMRTAAFISSQTAKDGPHPFNEGLPTLEMHRNLRVVQQAKHLMATGYIDDVIIGNAFADESELQALSRVNLEQIQLAVNPINHLSKVEHEVLFNEQHFNRGDINSYSVRSTFVKLKLTKTSIPVNNAFPELHRGDITIGNNTFGQYKGELNIVKEDMPNLNGHKNIVGKIIDKELFLLDYITPWKKFIFEEAKI